MSADHETIASNLRTSYLNRAASLLFPSQPSLSRCFLRGAAAAGYTNPTTNKQDSSSSTLVSVVDNCFQCRCCNFLLTPGMHGTKVRLRKLKRGTTRRRRNSRYKAVEASVKAQQSKHRKGNNSAHGGSGGIFSTAQRTVQKEEERREEYNMRRVTDGEAVNCSVYSCGMCGEKNKFKGISAATKHRRKRNNGEEHDQDDNDKELGNKKRRESGVVSTPLSSRSNKSRGGGTYTSHSFTKQKALIKNPRMSPPPPPSSSSLEKDLDFVPLTPPTASRSGGGVPMSCKAPKTTTGSTLLLLQSGKKKRKRKSMGDAAATPGRSNKSGLMDYLSSLND